MPQATPRKSLERSSPTTERHAGWEPAPQPTTHTLLQALLRVSRHVVNQPVEIRPSLKVVVLRVSNASEHREVAHLPYYLISSFQPRREHVSGALANSHSNKNGCFTPFSSGCFAATSTSAPATFRIDRSCILTAEVQRCWYRSDLFCPRSS